MKLYYLHYSIESGVTLSDFNVVDYSGGVVKYTLSGVVLHKTIEENIILDESKSGVVILWLLSSKSLIQVYSDLEIALNVSLVDFEASIENAKTYLGNLSVGSSEVFPIVTALDLYEAILVYPSAKIYYNGELCNNVFLGALDCDLRIGDSDIISYLKDVKGLSDYLCAFQDRPFSLKYDGNSFQVIKEV